MAFLSGIFGNNGQQQQQQAPQQQQPQMQQRPQQQQNPQAAPGAGGPASTQAQLGPANSQFTQPNGQQGAPGQQQQNPLDNFMNLLTPKQQGNQQQTPQGIFGDVPADQIQAQIKQANFVNGLDQAKVQSALSGDANAFMEVLNSVAQNAFAANMNLTRGMVEHGVTTGNKRLEGSLDSHFRNYQLKQQTPTTDNAALQHPVGKAFLGSISQQIANANPHMSAAEVAKAAEQNFLEFAKMLAPQQQLESQGQQKPQTDWLQYLE